MSTWIEKTVEVPLSKLHFEIYDPNSGDTIQMGQGIETRNFMFQAWTDDIHKFMVTSVEFPKFDYMDKSLKEPVAKLYLRYEKGIDYKKIEKDLFSR